MLHDRPLEAPIWKKVLIILGGVMISIMAGTTNAFNAISQKVQTDLQLSSSEISLLAGLGLLGLYFVVPAGYALDRWGPVKTSLVCTALNALGYTAMSYCDHKTWVIALISFTLVGFGCGGIFMAALGTSINISPSKGGLGVSLVAAGMSFSVATTVFAVNTYTDITHCNENHCWREYVRLFAWASLALPLPGSVLLLFYNKKEYPHLNESHSVQSSDETEDENAALLGRDQTKDTSFLSSLKVFRDIYFWALFWAFFVGIGASLVVLTHAAQIWESYNTDPKLAHWGDRILVIYSFANAASNVFCGVLSDWLATKQILRRSSFVALIHVLYAVIFCILGALFTLKIVTAFTAFLLASVGFLFGANLVLFPTIIADIYGGENFGKVFAFLEFSSSTASIIVPLIVGSVANATGTYKAIMFVVGGVLITSGIAVYKRQAVEP